MLDDIRSCTSCRNPLPDRAAFCPRCGLAVAGFDGDRDVTFIDQLARDRGEDRTETTGEVRRGEFRRGVLVVLAAVVAVSAWALARAPSTAQDGAESAVEESDESSEPAMLGRSDSSLDESGDGEPGESSNVDTDGVADDVTFELRVQPLDAVDIGAFAADGLALYLGDGDDVEHIDLTTGQRTRARGLGFPVATYQDRLILYRNGELYSLPQDNLAAIPFTLRRVDDPVGVLWATAPGDPPVPIVSRDRTAVWWPIAGSEIRWQRIRLSDGELEDEVTLEIAVGSPEVASAIGSGIYERIDGSWVKRQEGYIFAAGRDTAIGYSCDDPGTCQSAAYDLNEDGENWETIPLDIDVWELREYRLIDGGNRVLGLSPRGIYDLVAARRLADVSWTGSPTAVASGGVVVVAHAEGIDLFNLETGQMAEIEIGEFDPDRLLLVETR